MTIGGAEGELIRVILSTADWVLPTLFLMERSRVASLRRKLRKLTSDPFGDNSVDLALSEAC